MTAPAFWLLGTDTEIGKTAVALGLLAALDRIAFRCGSRRPVYLKPVQTGVALPPEDEIFVEDTIPGGMLPAGDARRAADEGYAAKTLFTFAAPASPALAARLEGKRLDAADVVTRIEAELTMPGQTDRPFIIEGAGGLLVPLNERESLLDVVRESDLPAVLVVGNKLGALNHARLTIDRLLAEGVPVLGLILNRTTPAEALDPGTLTLPSSNRVGKAEGKAEEDAASLAAEAQRAFLIDNAATLATLYPEIPLLAEIEYGTIESPAGVSQFDRAAAYLTKVLIERQKNHSSEPRHPIPNDAASLLKLDAEHIWHPYANPLMPSKIDLVRGAHGRTVTIAGLDAEGNEEPLELIDGTSAWWCSPFGATHPRLVERLRRQSAEFTHVMFGGLTHKPAIELTERLFELLPEALASRAKVFYSDSGSVAIEVARKMALQYQQAAGHPEKRRFLVPLGGYHGDTAGAMSFCDPKDGMHVRFNDTNRAEIFIEPPACTIGHVKARGAENGRTYGSAACASLAEAPFDPASLDAARAAFEKHGHEIAAVVLEPIAQCAGGMRFYHPNYLRGIRALCDQYGALLICDEIATGFGRTGTDFAVEHAGIVPDILCVGKALTGGVMGMAATVAAARVVDVIGTEAAAAGGGIFPHGPTYMANPLAAAVASESLALYRSQDWLAEVKRIEAALRTGLAPALEHPAADDIRVLGAIGVIETVRTPSAAEVDSMRAIIRNEGVWLRPFGRLIYSMPAFTTTDTEMEKILRAMRLALDAFELAHD